MSAAISLSWQGRLGFLRLGRTLAATLRTWRQRARERRELARLSEAELRDFGASSSEAFAEAHKPFWRP